MSRGARGARSTRICCRRIRDAPAEQHRRAFGIAHQPAQAGQFLRPGIPPLTAFRIKWLLLTGQATHAMTSGEMLNPPVLGWYPLRQAIASYLNIFTRAVQQRRTGAESPAAGGSLRLDPRHPCQPAATGGVERSGAVMGQQLLSGSCCACHRAGRSLAGIGYGTTCSATIAMRVLPSSPRRTRARWRSPSRCLAKPAAVDWASQNEGVDYQRRLRRRGSATPASAAVAEVSIGTTRIFMGTFSKTIMPSLRMAGDACQHRQEPLPDCADITALPAASRLLTQRSPAPPFST